MRTITLSVIADELSAFLLRVELAGLNPHQEIVLGGGNELLLHNVDHIRLKRVAIFCDS